MYFANVKTKAKLCHLERGALSAGTGGDESPHAGGWSSDHAAPSQCSASVQNIHVRVKNIDVWPHCRRHHNSLLHQNT